MAWPAWVWPWDVCVDDLERMCHVYTLWCCRCTMQKKKGEPKEHKILHLSLYREYLLFWFIETATKRATLALPSSSFVLRGGTSFLVSDWPSDPIRWESADRLGLLASAGFLALAVNGQWLLEVPGPWRVMAMVGLLFLKSRWSLPNTNWKEKWNTLIGVCCRSNSWRTACSICGLGWWSHGSLSGGGSKFLETGKDFHGFPHLASLKQTPWKLDFDGWKL